MLQECMAFLLFLVVSIIGWIISYSDYSDLLICYGCKKLEKSYDFVIVGGGTAGCVLARRLAENSSASILIIEAGGRGNRFLSIPALSPMLQQSNFDWKYTTTRQTGACLAMDKQRCKYPLGKILGGTHQLNNMIYTRGHPDDYAEWFKDLPGYSYRKDVEEYFNRTEQVYKMGETVSDSLAPAMVTPLRYVSELSHIIMNAFAKLDYPLSLPTQKYYPGFYRPMVTQKNGRRWTTSDHLLEMNFPNVFILTKATAEKINFNQNFEATGVKFDYLGDKMFVNANRALIISAGTIGSAKLLMLSGIGPKKHLKKTGIKLIRDLPVGNNLQDHVIIGFDLVQVEEDEEMNYKYLESINPMAFIKYLFGFGVLTSGGIELTGFNNENFVHCKNRASNNSTYCKQYLDERPDIEYIFMPMGLRTDNGVLFKSNLGITDQVWEDYFLKINRTSMSLMPILLHPKSKGTVRLLNKNPESMPLINPNYLTHPYDMSRFLSCIMQIRKIIDRFVPKKNSNMYFFDVPFPACNQYKLGSYCYWECYIKHTATTGHQPVGTCKMGANSNDSVVDFNYHVYGTNKLFVVDGSILPSAVSGSCIGAILMMAERAADYLKKFHGH